MRRHFVRGILFVGALCCVGRTFAESIAAEKVEYGAEAKLSDPAAGSCMIRATIISSAAPEIVNFRAGVWVGNNNGANQMFLGFTLDVGNWTYKNGVPVALRRTPISEAFFSSKTFSSRGRLYDVDLGDGGRGQMTGDASVGSVFLFAVYVGDYDLTFSAAGIDERTYHVNAIPGPPVLADYQRCVNVLLKTGQ